MLELLAFAPEDGWAYVRTGTGVRLIRPPYNGNSSPVESDREVAAALIQHGFVQPPDNRRILNDWTAVVDFLTTTMVVSRKQKGQEISDRAGVELLDLATTATLERFLDRIEAELLPNGERAHATKLLQRILAIFRVRGQANLHQRAREILARLHQETRGGLESSSRPEEVESKSDTAMRRAGAPQGGPDFREMLDEFMQRGRAVSIHIGVNRPLHRFHDHPLQYSEVTAWRMAELAMQAGYGALQLFRGRAATRSAVQDAFISAADSLRAGDTLLVTFSGYGVRSVDTDDEHEGGDEGWVLSDGVLLEDSIAESWRIFERGVRIVVVSERCYSGGSGRDDDEEHGLDSRRPRQRAGRRKQPPFRSSEAEDMEMESPCIVESARRDDRIRASVLMLSSSGNEQLSRDGFFTRHLLDLWDGGAYRGSYCDLFQRVRRRMVDEYTVQVPRILTFGVPDPELPMAPAFHLGGAGRRYTFHS